jgi:aspartyl-tRNA(Asn)/glutamyl-tRNA(Gln) amidotransferase subunit B
MKFDNEIVIGLEIHVELNTDTKLFCSCPTKGKEEPNSRTCEICLGHPGSKPKINKKAIEYALKLARALNCKISEKIIFSRKNYFYPDMSKNYQITQYEQPLGEKGYMFLEDKKIGITRVHLEEDPASLIHPSGLSKSKYVLVDYNRSGNPLCEIVTEPELNNPEEARQFMKSLITILQYLKIFDPDKNIIKADANVSIKESGYIRAEIKNISGFKEIQKALEYEILRQKKSLEDSQKLKQETRAWDSEAGITMLLRTKETEDDYGYIFDPDLVPIETKQFKVSIPELPYEKYKRYVKEFKISKEDAFVITNEYKLTELFEKTIKKINPVLAAKWIRREVSRVLNYNKLDFSEMDINAEEFIKMLELLEKNKITDRVAQKILDVLVLKKIDVSEYVKKQGLETVSDSGLIEKMCIDTIKENPKAVSDYKKGNENSLNFLLGHVMKKSKGKADPKLVKEILKKNI